MRHTVRTRALINCKKKWVGGDVRAAREVLEREELGERTDLARRRWHRGRMGVLGYAAVAAPREGALAGDERS
jgi:hypothetical protein